MSTRDSGCSLRRRPETCSSTWNFLFSRNRLNVAISRGRALAVVVASPRLLEANCTTVEQMRLVNGVCRFVEEAEARRAVTRANGIQRGFS